MPFQTLTIRTIKLWYGRRQSMYIPSKTAKPLKLFHLWGVPRSSISHVQCVHESCQERATVCGSGLELATCFDTTRFNTQRSNNSSPAKASVFSISKHILRQMAVSSERSHKLNVCLNVQCFHFVCVCVCLSSCELTE